MPKFVAAAFLLLAVSCTEPPFYQDREFPPLEGVHPGDTSDTVTEVLGKPDSWEDGLWMDGGVRYQRDYQVWFYAGKGRVVFNGFDGRVIFSQADARQPKNPTRPPYTGLYYNAD